MSISVCMTMHRPIKDPVPLMEKGRAPYPGGRFPPSFIHQVIIITALSDVLTLTMPLDADTGGGGGRPALKLKLFQKCSVWAYCMATCRRA